MVLPRIVTRWRPPGLHRRPIPQHFLDSVGARAVVPARPVEQIGVCLGVTYALAMRFVVVMFRDEQQS